MFTFKIKDKGTAFKAISVQSVQLCLELIEPSARKNKGQQFFLALTLFRVSLGFSHVLYYSRFEIIVEIQTEFANPMRTNH